MYALLLFSHCHAFLHLMKRMSEGEEKPVQSAFKLIKQEEQSSSHMHYHPPWPLQQSFSQWCSNAEQPDTGRGPCIPECKGSNRISMRTDQASHILTEKPNADSWPSGFISTRMLAIFFYITIPQSAYCSLYLLIKLISINTSLVNILIFHKSFT